MVIKNKYHREIIKYLDIILNKIFKLNKSIKKIINVINKIKKILVLYDCSIYKREKLNYN